MGDLFCGCGVVALAAIGVFLLTLRAVHGWSSRSCNLLGTLVVTAMVYYVLEFWYDARLARWLPTSSLIVVGNWLPLGAAVLAALVWKQSQGPLWRRSFTAGLLSATAAFGLIYPLLGRPPECGDQWDINGSCNQTTEYTCSPAAAATLLKLHGIESSEREMAELCLTRHGTSWPGLYRGLKLKTAGTKWDVEVLSCSATELAKHRGPMILSVGLERGARVDANFSRETGWVAGVNHSVVLQHFTRYGAAEILDPSQPFCREQWDPQTMRILWRGLAIRFVERNRL